MQTIKSLQKQIATLKKEAATGKYTTAQENKIRREISFLRLCIRYMELEPTKEYLTAEADKLKKSIARIDSQWVNVASDYTKRKNGDSKKALAEYRKDTNLSTIKKQFKAINFLLT